MNKYPLIVACTAALYSGMTLATTVNEVEPNNVVSDTQYLDSSAGDITVYARMGDDAKPHIRDVDYFSFEATEGDVLTISIEDGYSKEEPLDLLLIVYGPGEDYLIERVEQSKVAEDGGYIDPRIENLLIPETGVYTAVVSPVPSSYSDGGSVFPGRSLSGFVISDYTLKIAGFDVPSDVMQVAVEVKPGNRDLARLNPRSRGLVPFAIYGSADFDVAEIDIDSLTFGSNGDEQSVKRCATNTSDINEDGYQDLRCFFDNQAAAFQADDLEGVLQGMTTGGQAFEGRTYLKVIAVRR